MSGDSRLSQMDQQQMRKKKIHIKKGDFFLKKQNPPKFPNEFWKKFCKHFPKISKHFWKKN